MRKPQFGAIPVFATPEAPATGYMFDKGVYFADSVSKSANYCWADPRNPVGVLLLCDFLAAPTRFTWGRVDAAVVG